MTEQNKTPLTAQPGSAPAPEQKPAEKRPAEKPLRRVGSLTLGACLIAAGVFFLLYFFVPGFDVQLTLKIAPAVALVLLGCEVLFFAARPGRWKYDFVSVLVCLVLMAGCFCMAMLPLLWDELSGENQQTMNRLSAQAIDELYTACKRDAQDIAIRDISGRLYLSGPQVETLQQGEIHKHRDKRSLTVCGHKRDHLILDHLHTTVDLFSYTHLCYFIDFLLIQIQPDLFKLCPDLYPEFFTAHLYERCQMGQ